MKLLFDQNLSFRLVSGLQDFFPGCGQVRRLGLEDKSDREIWEFSRKEGYTIVTFDADFYDMATLYGHPPKIVWLRIGNTTTSNLIKVLSDRHELIKAFVSDTAYKEIGCLEID